MRDISKESVNSIREEILNTITCKDKTHMQKIFMLAAQADSLLDVLDYPKEYNYYKEKGIICDLGEGNAPLRPRYICANVDLLFKKGCDFLGLTPPTDLFEAINTLLIFYKNVPSVTNYPVYIGNIDTLLESFVIELPYETAKRHLRLFLLHIDRTTPDAFCHANIGPKASITGKIILELMQELQNAVPNLTIKYDKDITTDDFATLCIKTQLVVSNPGFANHKMFVSDLTENYAIASCYNGLLISGGAYTLVRIVLGKLSKLAENSKHFFDEVLPKCVKTMLELIEERVRFIAEETNFFETSFLSKEGFIDKDNFTAMFGMVGLAQCVNDLMEKDQRKGRYGNSDEADDLGIKIMKEIDRLNDEFKSKYCKSTNNKFLLHGQVGMDTDVDQTPNCRIPIGEEPNELSYHLTVLAKFHGFFPSGAGEIFRVESTVMKNPEFVLDIIKSAFDDGVRYLTFHDSNSDVIRVTGYLAKRSEIEKLSKGDAVLAGSTFFGKGAVDNSNVLNRKTR